MTPNKPIGPPDRNAPLGEFQHEAPSAPLTWIVEIRCPPQLEFSKWPIAGPLIMSTCTLRAGEMRCEPLGEKDGVKYWYFMDSCRIYSEETMAPRRSKSKKSRGEEGPVMHSTLRMKLQPGICPSPVLVF